MISLQNNVKKIIDMYNADTEEACMVYIVEDDRIKKFGHRVLVDRKNYFMSEDVYFNEFERMARIHNIKYNYTYISFRKFIRLYGGKRVKN